MMSEAVTTAKALGSTLKAIRVRELELRQERIRLHEEWAQLYKSLSGTELAEATAMYWDAQRDD
jgi:hypothetical protein